MLVCMFMIVGFCFNIKKNVPSTDLQSQTDTEFDAPTTIRAIVKALESGGHTVIQIEANKEAYLKLYKYRKKIDIVFNMAEGFAGDARESQIPAMCDMLGIPYTHSSTLTNALKLNKAVTKKILHYYGIPTPKFQLFNDVSEPITQNFKYPVLVKPNAEGSSKGILNENLVENSIELKKRLNWLWNHFKQPLLVEEFLDGREFTVALLGNPPKVLPIIEQRLDRLPAKYAPFASFEVKWLWEDSLEDSHFAYDCPAILTDKLQKKIAQVSLDTFEILGCKDVARVDIRLDKKGIPNVLEINTIPGMIPDLNSVSYLPIAARAAGFNYNQLVLAILNAAIKRYNLNEASR